MAFLSAFDICASGMTAQRLRLDVASQNVANIQTTRTEGGETYRRKMVVFQAADDSFCSVMRRTMNRGRDGERNAGVIVTQIVDDETEMQMVYNPEHPDADENGYVTMPNVDLIKETTDAMAATRSYQANITAFNAIKLMAQKALEIGK